MLLRLIVSIINELQPGGKLCRLLNKLRRVQRKFKRQFNYEDISIEIINVRFSFSSLFLSLSVQMLFLILFYFFSFSCSEKQNNGSQSHFLLCTVMTVSIVDNKSRKRYGSLT